MRNIIIGLAFLITFVFSVVSEPIADVIDTIGGSTNATYALTIDSIAGVTTDDDDDDDDDDDEDDD